MTVITWKSGCSSCHLRELGLCQALKGPEEIACLESMRQPPRLFPAARAVYLQGARDVPLYNIESGWLFSYQLLTDGRRQIMQFLLPGDIAGLDLDGSAGMTHGLDTLTDSVLCSIPRGGFQVLCDSCPVVANHMQWIRARDMALLSEHAVSLGRRTARESMANLFMELAVRSVRSVQLISGTSLRMPLTQPIIADALGLTSIHVNRVLSDLRKARIMELKNKMLTILDMEQLTRLANSPEGFLELWGHKAQA